jgi:hypothetical protein
VRAATSHQSDANRPVLAICSNLKALSTLRAASSFAAATVLASALLHSTPSTMEQSENDQEMVYKRTY